MAGPVVVELDQRAVLRVGGADLYLDGALLSLGRTVTVDRLSPSAAEAQRARWPDYDLVVFDGVSPATPPVTGRFLYLDAHGAGSPFARTRSCVAVRRSSTEYGSSMYRRRALSWRRCMWSPSRNTAGPFAVS